MLSCVHYIGDEDGRSHSKWNINRHTNACGSVWQARCFDAESDERPQYEERMLCYFEANGITNESKMKAIFLSAVGARTHKLLRNLTAPAKPIERSFADLREALSNQYNPKPSVMVQRLRFNSRVRHTGESVAEFVSALRALSEFCEYGQTLNEMLRNRLVCGIDDERTQRRLLAERSCRLRGLWK